MTSNNETSEWLEISIDINPVAHESVSAFLFDLGCSGVVSKDFQDCPLKSYLTFPENLDGIRNRISVFLGRLKEIFPEIPSPELTLTKIEDQDWNVNWRRFFHADRVTPRLMFVPSWEPVPDVTGGHVIRIDPGPAFEPAGCICGDILRGVKTPADCNLFGKACTPEYPVGPCMVSSEGSCSAYYLYGGDFGG